MRGGICHVVAVRAVRARRHVAGAGRVDLADRDERRRGAEGRAVVALNAVRGDAGCGSCSTWSRTRRPRSSTCCGTARNRREVGMWLPGLATGVTPWNAWPPWQPVQVAVLPLATCSARAHAPAGEGREVRCGRYTQSMAVVMWFARLGPRHHARRERLAAVAGVAGRGVHEAVVHRAHGEGRGVDVAARAVEAGRRDVVHRLEGRRHVGESDARGRVAVAVLAAVDDAGMAHAADLEAGGAAVAGAAVRGMA